MQLIRAIIFTGFSFLLVSHTPSFPTLDEYLTSQGVQIQEGYMTDVQKVQFSKALNRSPWVKTIAEIGLNAGHSAENFFNNCENLELFVSFDINYWSYVKNAIDYLSSKYGDRFSFMEGDSTQTVPLYSKTHQDIKFDLIYVDGNHSYQGCLMDLINSQLIAKPNALVWIDDYQSPEVQQAINDCVARGLLIVDKIHTRDRHWVEAHYTL